MSHSRKKAKRYRTKATIVEAEAEEDIEAVAIGDDPVAKQAHVQGRNMRAVAVGKDTPPELLAESRSPVKISSNATIKKSKTKGDASATSDVNVHFNMTLSPVNTSVYCSLLSHPVPLIQGSKTGGDENESKVNERKLSSVELCDQALSQAQEETIKTKIIRYADYNRKIFCKIDLVAYLKVEKLDCSLVVLDKEDLSEAIFSGIVFHKASFKFANLENVRFTNADLSEASLQHAILAGVDFSGTNLSFADISHAKGLTWELLEKAIFNEENAPKVDKSDVLNSQLRSAVVKIKRLKKIIEEISQLPLNEMQIQNTKEKISYLECKQQSELEASLYPDFAASELTIPYKKNKPFDLISILLDAFDQYVVKAIFGSFGLPRLSIGVSRDFIGCGLTATAGVRACHGFMDHDIVGAKVALFSSEQQLFTREIINKDESISSALSFNDYVIENKNEYDLYVRQLKLDFIESMMIRASGNAKKQALYFAARQGYVELAKVLLNSRASLSSEGSSHDSPLFIAVQNGHEDIVKLLLEERASANTSYQDFLNTTTLHIAARYDRANIAELLLQHHALVNQKDRNKWIPIEIAAYYKSSNVFGLLLKHERSKVKKLSLQILDFRLYTPLQVESVIENDALEEKSTSATFLNQFWEKVRQVIDFSENLKEAQKSAPESRELIELIKQLDLSESVSPSLNLLQKKKPIEEGDSNEIITRLLNSEKPKKRASLQASTMQEEQKVIPFFLSSTPKQKKQKETAQQVLFIETRANSMKKHQRGSDLRVTNIINVTRTEAVIDKKDTLSSFKRSC